MNFLSRKPQEEPTLPLAPMIDIIFLLLIFFMTTSIFARMENELSVTVPTAESAETPQRALGELIINIKQNGELVVNQQTLSQAELRALLSRLAERFPDQAVIIRADRQSNWENLVDVLDICAQSGIWNFKFAALPPPESSP